MPINTESQGFILPFAQGGSLCYSVNVGVFNKFYNRKVKYIFLRSRSIILWKHKGRKLTCKQHSHLGGEQAGPVLSQEESEQRCPCGQSYWS